MKAWPGSVAVVTGAGSGIGRALALAMSARGAQVVVTDIDEAAAATVAAECGPKATAHHLDVRDATAVQALIDATFRLHGRLDYVFNNAGIGIGGEAHEISRAAWERIIDVNLRGVMHGTLAAYPLMLKQGWGHIINTASLAGLGAAPLLAPYAMTKHAVVGLTSSLRLEAAAHGVRVSALCPAAIETPLLDKRGPADLPVMDWVPDLRRYLSRLAGPPHPVAKFAEQALTAIERNQGVIVIPGRARLTWVVSRFFPGVAEKIGLSEVQAERASRIRSVPIGVPLL